MQQCDEITTSLALENKRTQNDEVEMKTNILLSANMRTCKKILKFVTVEPLLMTSMFTIVMYSIVSQQYIYYRISKDYGIENITSEPSACHSNNVSNVTKQLQEQVSKESSDWIMYLNIAGFIPSFFTTVLIGTWGDRVGRRAPLFCSFMGLLLMVVIYIIVIHDEMQVTYLLIARIVAGLCGDFNSILCSCYAYLADISKQKNRTVRVAIGEACTGIGGFIASVLSGVWIDAQGFEPPLWILFALLFTSLLYILFILCEPISSTDLDISVMDKMRKLFTCQEFASLSKFLRENLNKTFKLLGIVLCFFLQLCIHDGTGDIVVIYELSPPLCWSSMLIGFGSALRDSAYLFGVAFVKLLSGRLTDIVLILISCVSSTSALLFYAFATYTWTMLAGYSFAVLRTVSATVLRSMSSRLAGKENQGSSFALIACAESLAALVSSFIFNGVYSATVHTFRGAVFIVGAGLQICFFILTSFVYHKTKHDLAGNEAEEYHSFHVNSVELARMDQH